MTIYFIQAGRNGPIKIGIASDPQKRLESLQTGSPLHLHLLGTMPGDNEQEKALHARFSAHRLRGEWFSPESEILAYIDDAAEEERDSWVSMVRLEPRLLDLLREAQSVYDDGSQPSFCANWYWYREGGLKDRMSELVGWTAVSGARKLRSMQAYDIAYHAIYECLPGCRDCTCF